jgi:Fur family transcriptional regulator, ferric uptake regulator
MHKKGMTMKEEEEVFHRHLKSTGNKITSQRDAILKVFLEASGHLTAQEIYQRARAEDPTLGFTTVYRTMKLLVESGIARSEKFDDGHLRYEYDYRQRHHDHLICTECGLVIEFYNEFIEDEQTRITREFGFKTTHHSMKIFGVCGTCSDKGRRRRSRTSGGGGAL